MEINERTLLIKEAERFKAYMDNLVLRSTDLYKSILLDEKAAENLLVRVGEIPSIQGPNNEHKTDT